MAESPSPKSSALRILTIIAVTILGIPSLIGLLAYHRLHYSLPITDGEVSLPGLSERVLVARDAGGIPTVSGTNREDVSRALGFLHAQERFFQMDLMRRQAAGELSELFGENAVDADRHYRLHRFRTRAREILSHIPETERRLLDAYTVGVNAGLAALDQAPLEYLLLLTTPEPWTQEDSILSVYAMYFTLQDSRGTRESTRGLMADVLDPEVYSFLNPAGTTWDAPIDDSSVKLPSMPASPGFDTAVSDDENVPRRAKEEEAVPGSNNWVVAGTLTPHGSAIVANDMHLGIGVPNLWYRASIEYMHDERPITMSGLSFPGTPVMSAGSNGSLAWGFTNSYGDWYDLVELEQPTDPDHYLTPHGELPIETVTETIYVRGKDPITFDIRETIWGPLVAPDHRGTQRAYRWVAHSVRAINLNLMRMEWTQDIAEGLSVAKRIGMPAQNIVMGDSQGNIAWTIAGAIPNRVGFDGRLPTSWADGSRIWDGWVAPENYPQIVNPESQRIWTANSRVVGDDKLAILGDGDYALGARSKQIRDDLLGLKQANESDLFNVQLDNRALFLSRWQELLLQLLATPAGPLTPELSEFREIVSKWDARASTDSVGYTLVRAFRLQVRDRLFSSVLKPLTEHQAGFRYLDAHRQVEGPLWELITQEPKGWLPAEHASWNEFLFRCVDETIAELTADGSKLSDQAWGKHNAPQFTHPLSNMVPALSRWLDLPTRPLAGDVHMPLIQAGRHGASERMVVAPGQEDQGIMQMPSSQTGHIWSPYFGEGHQAWAEGRPTPFLPGPTEYRLIISPEKP